MQHIYTDKFRFQEILVPVKDLSLVDPKSVKTNDATYYSLADSARKSLAYGLGLQGYQFSNKLYSTDSKLWKELVAKKELTTEVINYRSHHSALIVDGDTICVVPNESTSIDKLLKALNTYYNDEELLCEYTYDPLREFLFKATRTSDHTGILLRFSISSMRVKVNQFYTDSTGTLIVSPFTIVDKSLDDDIELVLDKSVCLDMSSFDESTRNDYLAGLTVKMSIDELSWYFRRVLGINIKKGVDIDVLQMSSDRDYSPTLTERLDTVMRILDQHTNCDPVVYYSSYLKRAVTMSPVSYGVMAELISQLFVEDKVDLGYLISIYDTIMRHKSHYQQLEL